MKRLTAVIAAGAILAGAYPTPTRAQHIIHPVDLIEQRLLHEPFQVTGSQGSRAEGDRTQQVSMSFEDSLVILVKWAKVAQNGETFNNVPRYEVAAYEIQKLFLEEADYVVPPSVLRSFPLAWYQAEYEEGARPTFGNTGSVFVTLQYWLWPPLTPFGELDRERFRNDDQYARGVANFNVLTYLIRHSDSNLGNYLMSDSDASRIFSVDNGVAFRSAASNRGFYWRDLRVDRVPASTAERLARITLEDLQERLGVVAQFELRDDHYEMVEPGANFNAGSGVRRRDGVLQFGLTTAEIRDVHGRLERLVSQIASGRLTAF